MVCSHDELLAAIVGQPNSGKTTVFRALTRIPSEISNYPGVTTDAQSGRFQDGDRRVEVVDLPGTYTFSTSTTEERIAKNFVLLDRPEVVVDVLDASNFRRHLFLTLELLEMQIPAIVCLNFMDVARRRGVRFDVAKLERLLGVPTIEFVATREEGLARLRTAVLNVSEQNDHAPTCWKIDYGPELEEYLSRLEAAIRTKAHLAEDFSPRWLAVKLMENDRETRRLVEHHTHDETWRELLDFCDEQFNFFINEYKSSPRKIILERRNQFADFIDKETVSRIKARTIRFSDRIDSVVCHPFFGPIALFLIMATTFQLTFKIADGWSWVPWISTRPFSVAWTTPVEFLATFFSQTIPEAIDSFFHLKDGAWRDLLLEGILPGVGGVIQFVPVIFVMFSALSVLEQSGYIARVAMVMDGFMRRFGLQGQSVLPMILGGGISGGCAVPAILATRSISNPRQRVLTLLVIPMLNCGGKVPVYAMIIAAFFASAKGWILGGVVFFSWIVSLCSAWILGKTLVRGNELPLLLELPTYQFPRMGDVLRTAAGQSGEFLKKAGTVILAANILLWLLLTYPKSEPRPTISAESVAVSQGLGSLGAESQRSDGSDAGTQNIVVRPNVVSNESERRDRKSVSDVEYSYAAALGRFLEPVSRWAGFDWRDNVALLSGTGSKELIISSLSTLYQADETSPAVDSNANGTKTFENNENGESRINDGASKQRIASSDVGGTLRERLSRSPNWSPLKALSALVFIMLYAPCSGTLIAIYRTTGRWRWVGISFLYNSILAFLLAVVIYQVGSLF